MSQKLILPPHDLLRILRTNASLSAWTSTLSLLKRLDLSKIEEPFVLHDILDEFYIAAFNDKEYDLACEILTHFRRCHIDDHILSNTNFLLAPLRHNKKVIATFDPSRRPEDNEIIICYGDFPHSADNLVSNNPVYRHLKYFEDISHDEVEADPVWSFVDAIYVLNLDERYDRYIETLRECARMGIPLNKVKRFSACRDKTTDNKTVNGWIGCATSHLKITQEIIEKGYQNTLVLEDDFTFTSDIDRNKRDLRTFFERKYDYDVCLLATSKYYRTDRYDDLLSLSFHDCTTASAYLMSYDGVRRVERIWVDALKTLKEIEMGEKYKYACDRSWCVLQKDRKFFFFTKKMGFQRPSYSNNTGAIEFHLD